MLAEAFDRLRWVQFFQITGTEQCIDALCEIKALLDSLFMKDREESQQMMKNFGTKPQDIVRDFELFNREHRLKIETWAYWDIFLQTVTALQDLVQADRNGNWNLHMQSVQYFLPLYAAVGHTRYLC
jgi:hypothetical protein